MSVVSYIVNKTLGITSADIGNVADAPATADTGSFSVISLLKRISANIASLASSSGSSALAKDTSVQAISTALTNGVAVTNALGAKDSSLQTINTTLTNGIPVTNALGAKDATLTALQTALVTAISNTQPRTISQTTVSYTDRSGSITAGGTSQIAVPVNATRRSLIIQNPSNAAGQGLSASESLYINFTNAAGIGNGSIELLPGGSYESDSITVSSEAVNIYAVTTGHKFTIKEA